MRCRPPFAVPVLIQDWGRLPWFAPFLRRAFFLRRRFEDMDTSVVPNGASRVRIRTITRRLP